MRKIEIATPIWKDRSVGLNIEDMESHEQVSIEIMYVSKKTGLRIYPGIYVMNVREIETYPTQMVRQGIIVHIIPIIDLETYKIIS